MAPQQNSTLIDDNLNTGPSLLNLNEKQELQLHYSPILPTNNPQQLLQNRDEDNNNSTGYLNYNTNINKNIEIIAEKKETAHNTNEHLWAEHQKQQKQQQHKCKHGRYGNNQHSRSISLNGVNSTTEQGNKEIPIWLDDEPRYVSGVTNKTTCNDIIKALIDDEIRNGNQQYCCTRIVDGEVTTSRDYSDYVITENWRGIERSYDGNMAVLPIWHAWSRVHNELRLVMKHRKDIRDPLQMPQHQKTATCALFKYFKKLFSFSKKRNKIKQTKSKQLPDEFVLVLLPDQLYEKDSNAQHKCVNRKLKTVQTRLDNKLVKTKLYRLAETRISSKRKSRNRTTSTGGTRRQQQLDETYAHNCIRRQSKNAPMRNSLRHKLAQKNAEINAMYEREYELTKQLRHKSKLYKLQNELYTNPQMEISVGQIQRNIEDYAAEIIKTQHELLELKNEIQQDISIINNLKRMTITDNDEPVDINEQPVQAQDTQIAMETKQKMTNNYKNKEQMQFVDNIYEFCDNNASMLV